MRKIVACYIVEKDEDVLELSVESIKGMVDAIVIVDGNKDTSTQHYSWIRDVFKGTFIYLQYPYQHGSKGANGHQRNQYLNYVKEHFKDWYCLVIDADEVVDNKSHIFFDELERFERDGGWTVFHPQMIHYINHFGQEDATVNTHWCLTRFFKITDDLYYPEVEHTVINDGTKPSLPYPNIILHHLGYCREMFNIRKKYLNHKEKSNIHSKEFLQDWYYMHLTGKYPVRPFKFEDIPQVIKDYFVMKDVEEPHYFWDRQQLEAKHMYETLVWNEYFKPRSVLEVGCGFGQRNWCFKNMGVPAWGFDISKYAIAKSPFNKTNLVEGDVKDTKTAGTSDFVVVYDLLEHISYDDIDMVLENIYKMGSKNYLFSIPVVGDPNLENDPTHIIRESKDWWKEKISIHGMQIVDTPAHFPFREQILVAKKI